MIDATKAVEIAKKVHLDLYTSSRSTVDDAAYLLEFCRQVERERAAMPEKLKRLRDEFAGQALISLAGKVPVAVGDAESGLTVAEVASREAYVYADEMLKAREKSYDKSSQEVLGDAK